MPRNISVEVEVDTAELEGDEEKYQLIASWLELQIRNNGWEKTVNGLEDWLSELSRRGNGDDSTLALMQWIEED